MTAPRAERPDWTTAVRLWMYTPLAGVSLGTLIMQDPRTEWWQRLINLGCTIIAYRFAEEARRERYPVSHD